MKNRKISEVTKKISLKIKSERLKKNFSQKDLALKANLRKDTICKIEQGEVSLTIKTLQKIASALNINYLDFF